MEGLSGSSLDPASIVGRAVKPVSEALDPLGYVAAAYGMVGLTTPITRGLGTMAATFLILNWFKPSYFYAGDQMRPWSVLDDSPSAVLMPVSVTAVLFGLIAAGF